MNDMGDAMAALEWNRPAQPTPGWTGGLSGLTAEAVPGRGVYAAPAERP
jgi:hypothetical protein